jgi:sporulation protein YlmC with PRC-barrel domain
VISINEGARLGTVKDIALHPGDRQVEGFLLSTEGHDGYLPFARLSKIGPDAIMVESKSAVVPEGEAAALFSVNELGKMEVMNTAGTKLGSVADLEFDLTSGALASIELKAGGVFGIGAQKSVIPASQIRSFGEDVITVEAADPGA